MDHGACLNSRSSGSLRLPHRAPAPHFQTKSDLAQPPGCGSSALRLGLCSVGNLPTAPQAATCGYRRFGGFKMQRSALTDQVVSDHQSSSFSRVPVAPGGLLRAVLCARPSARPCASAPLKSPT